jgi:uncharacterized repeat protein (TIGR01451 family)
MSARHICLVQLAFTLLCAPAVAEPPPGNPAATPACFCRERPVSIYSYQPFFPAAVPIYTPPVAPIFPIQPTAPVQAAPVTAPENVEGEELPTPVVTIRVQVPALSAVGQELEYRSVVENRSSAAAHHVVVRDRVPVNARYVRANPEPTITQPELEWRLGSMAGGARQEIRLVLSPTGGGDVDNCVRVEFEHGVRLRTRLTRPTLQLQKQGPVDAQLFDALNYQLTVTNTGNSPAANVLIVDDLPEGLEHKDNRKQLSFPIGSLAPGESRNVSYEVIAKKTGRFTNRAVVTADGGLRDEVQSAVNVNEALLVLKMTAPRQQSFGRSIPYELTLTNNGSAPLTNVVLIDKLPAKAAFVSASDSGRLAGTQVEWSLGTLAAGATKKVELKLRPTTAGDIVNLAEARADRGHKAMADATTSIVGEAGLLFEVVDTEDPIEVGGNTQYNIIIRNQGSVPATNIRITATVPAELAVSKVTGPTDHKKDGRKVVFEPLNLPSGQDTIYRVQVRGIKAGDARFRVELTSDQLKSGPLLEEESTNVFEAGKEE